MLIEIPIFRGELPIIDAKYLPVEHAQIATNADLTQNTLKPFYATYNSKTLDATAWRSIFLIRHNGAIFWLCSEQEISAINLSIQDSKERFCYADGVQAQESDWPLASNNGTNTYGSPNTAYYLGVPKPKGTLTVAPKEAAGIDEGDLLGSIAYVYTFVTDWGYESEPSDPSCVIDIREGQYIELRNFEIPVPTNYNIVGIRIYRTATGSGGTTDFQLVTKIMTGGTSPDYITPAEIIANGYMWEDKDTGDNEITDDLDLGEVIACSEYSQPPADIKGLITLPNAVTVGYKGREVYLSEPYIHYGFPTDYRITTDFDIKSIGWYGTTIVVGTEGYPYKINGYDPQNVSVEKQPDPQSCLFSRAMVSGPRFVLYPSPDGLYMISDEGNRNVTAGIFTKEQWRDLLSDQISYDKTIIAFLYDDKYYAFFEGTNEGFIIDFKSTSQFYAAFTLDSGISVYGGHVDLIDDSLYLLTETDSTYYITKWEGFNNLEIIKFLDAETEGSFLLAEDGGKLITTGTDGITEDFLIYRWKSKIFVTSHAFFSCMKVDGDFSTGDITINIYKDDSLFFTKTVTSSDPFRIPSGTGKDWEIEATGDGQITNIKMAQAMAELI